CKPHQEAFQGGSAAGPQRSVLLRVGQQIQAMLRSELTYFSGIHVSDLQRNALAYSWLANWRSRALQGKGQKAESRHVRGKVLHWRSTTGSVRGNLLTWCGWRKHRRG